MDFIPISCTSSLSHKGSKHSPRVVVPLKTDVQVETAEMQCWKLVTGSSEPEKVAGNYFAGI